MMIKARPATVILTTSTVKSVVFGSLGVASIHGGKNGMQPIKKIGQNRIINVTREMCQDRVPNYFFLITCCKKCKD